MSRRRLTKDYTKLEIKGGAEKEEMFRYVKSDMTDGFVEEQFIGPERKFPWKTACFVWFLMVLGSMCLLCAMSILFGVLEDQGRFWPLLILGSLTIIPGGYFGFIFFNVMLKRAGYSLDDLPDI